MIQISTVATLAMLVSGCASGNSTQNSTQNSTSPEGKSSPTTLTIMAVRDPIVENYDTNAFTKYIEKKANVKIKWQLVGQGNAQAKLSATLAGGNLPDIVMGFNIPPAEEMAYGQQGVFIPLNSYINKYGTNVKKMFAQMPIIRKYITAPNGKIYALPNYAGAIHITFPDKLWIYNPWLKKLNLSVPTTTQQFKKTLEEFKAKNPSGTGKVIPLSGATVGSDQAILHLMSSFIYTDPKDDYLFLKNGKVIPAAVQPQWKQGLEYMHSLYEEGLIAPETFTQNISQYRKMANQQPNILGAAAALAQSGFTQITTSTSGGWHNWVSVPPLKGPSGTAYPMYQPLHTFQEGMFLITSNCKNPEAAFKFGDLFFNKDVIMRKRLGVPGKDWSWTSSGKGVDGKKALYTVLQAYGNRENDFWGAPLTPEYFPSTLWGGKAAKNDPFSVGLVQDTQTQYGQYTNQPEKSLPPLWFNSTQSDQVSKISATITPYIQSMTAKFITGQANIGTQWNTYVKTLQSMGMSKMVKIYQSTYNKSFSNS